MNILTFEPARRLESVVREMCDAIQRCAETIVRILKPVIEYYYTVCVQLKRAVLMRRLYELHLPLRFAAWAARVWPGKWLPVL